MLLALWELRWLPVSGRYLHLQDVPLWSAAQWKSYWMCSYSHREAGVELTMGSHPCPNCLVGDHSHSAGGCYLCTLQWHTHCQGIWERTELCAAYWYLSVLCYNIPHDLDSWRVCVLPSKDFPWSRHEYKLCSTSHQDKSYLQDFRAGQNVSQRSSIYFAGLPASHHFQFDFSATAWSVHLVWCGSITSHHRLCGPAYSQSWNGPRCPEMWYFRPISDLSAGLQHAPNGYLHSLCHKNQRSSRDVQRGQAYWLHHVHHLHCMASLHPNILWDFTISRKGNHSTLTLMRAIKTCLPYPDSV